MMLVGQHAPYLEHQMRGLSLFRPGIFGAGAATSFLDASWQAPHAQLGIRITGANGAKIRPGVKGTLHVPFDCTIDYLSLMADAAGSIVFDVYRKTSAAAGFPGRSDTLCPLEIGRPRLAGAALNHDHALFGWTKTLNRGNGLLFEVLEASGINTVTLTLFVLPNHSP